MRNASERYFLHRGKQRGLRSTLSRQPVIGHLHVQIPSSSERVARRANLEVRVAHGAIRSTSRPVKWLPISAVRLREVETVPSGESPISWTLLTTHAVQTLSQAQEVLHSYVMRWRIEEFHKTWKSGACCVEQSQLRSFNAIRRWATILAAVAARVERLKQLSREQPDLDALKELSREEIDSAILLSEHKKYRPGDALTIREAVRLIARVGGYLDRKGDGPPGSITIRRGLERIVPAARILSLQRSG